MPFLIQWVDQSQGPLQTVTIQTPAGALTLSLRGGVIVDADWLSGNKVVGGLWPSELSSEWQNLQCEIDPNLSVRLLKQGSPYRLRVWAELCRIPFGTTLSYSALAARLGSSPRAVGNACRDNPYPFIIPCHRIVSMHGIGGYCGKTQGGFIDIKSRLLEFESTCKHRMQTA